MDGGHPSCCMNLCNMLSIQKYVPSELEYYSHNHFIPNQYPMMTVTELRAILIHKLTRNLAQAKEEQTLGLASIQLSSKNEWASRILDKLLLTIDPNVEEKFTISNMSEAHIVNSTGSAQEGDEQSLDIKGFYL